MTVFRWRSREFSEWYLKRRRRPSFREMYAHLGKFSHVEGFHGCRTSNTDSYYSSGFLIPDAEEIRKKAALLLKTNSEDLKKLERNKDELEEDTRFFAIDSRHLIDQAGHYMIYGSERVIAYAAALTKKSGFDRRQDLTKIGKPTLFNVNLPVEVIGDSAIEDLAEHIPAMTWESVRDIQEIPRFDWTFFVKSAVPGRWITAHSHPQDISDPYYYGTKYRH